MYAPSPPRTEREAMEFALQILHHALTAHRAGNRDFEQEMIRLAKTTLQDGLAGR